MLAFENQNIEFKQEYVPDIRKEVMGFANAEGGTVYVGVRKDGVTSHRRKYQRRTFRKELYKNIPEAGL